MNKHSKAPASPRPVAATTGGTTGTNDLQSVVLQQIQSAAQPTATSLNLPNVLPVDETGLGDLPWFWESGEELNDLTYNWLNNIFVYNATDGYVGSSGDALMTEYQNVMEAITYALDASDDTTLTTALTAVQNTVNNLISDWQASSSFPSNVSGTAGQLNYIASQVLTWGASGLTMSQLRSSTNPTSLLSNVPIWGSQIASDFITYIQKTSSVATIQNTMLAQTNEISDTVTNSQPISPAPATPPTGYINTIAGLCVPAITAVESTTNISNALGTPTNPGPNQFTAQFTAAVQSDGQLQVTSSSGAVGYGDLLFFLAFTADEQQYGLFSADSSLTTCSVTMTFSGVTTLTPQYASYNTATGAGWWNPTPIADAVANTPSSGDVPAESGYIFLPLPQFNFAANGNFGVIGALLISQQPTIQITYTTSNTSSIQQFFSQQSSWGVDFLGVGLGGGSESYFSSSSQVNTQGTAITVTIGPAVPVTPPAFTQQLAYVIAASMIWPGAQI